MKDPISKPIDPYPGLFSFQDRREDRLLFFGRNRDKEALLHTVLSENLTLVFGQSGTGKTSLINAGLLEPLRERGFFPVVARLTYDEERGPLSSIYTCMKEEAQRRGISICGDFNQQSLWEFFQGAKFEQNGEFRRPILIIDQFEELFTLLGKKKDWQESFIRQLSDLVRRRVPQDVRSRGMAQLESLKPGDSDRERIVSLLYEGAGPDIKVIICIREDYLADLETLQTTIPGIFRNRFRLGFLTPEAARQAIKNPSQAKEVLGEANVFEFEEKAVDEIIAFLRRRQIHGEWTEGEEIEPSHLQVLCRSLNERRKKRKVHSIRKVDLRGAKGMQRIIRGYYHDILSKYPRLSLGVGPRRKRNIIRRLLRWFCPLHRPRRAVRDLCERGLITLGGSRNICNEENIIQGFGVAKKYLLDLVYRRLLRSQARLGSTFYELSHDALVEPISQSHRRRRRLRLLMAAGLMAVIFIGSLTSLLYRDYREGLMKDAWRQTELKMSDADEAIQGGDYKQALKLYQEVLTIARKIDNRPFEAVALRNIGNVEFERGQYPQALDRYKEALLIFQEQEQRRDELIVLGNIAEVYRNLREYLRALEYSKEALNIARNIGSRELEASSLLIFARICIDRREYTKAVEYARESSSISNDIGDREGMASALGIWGKAYNDQALYGTALDPIEKAQSIFFVERALSIFREFGNKREAAFQLNTLGSIFENKGDLDRAREYYRDAVAIYRTIAAGGRDVEEAKSNLRRVDSKFPKDIGMQGNGSIP